MERREWICPKCGGNAEPRYENNTEHLTCTRCAFAWWDDEHEEWRAPAPQPDADTLRKLWRVAQVAREVYLAPDPDEAPMDELAKALDAIPEVQAHIPIKLEPKSSTLAKLWRVAEAARAFTDRPGNWDAEVRQALDALHETPPKVQPDADAPGWRDARGAYVPDIVARLWRVAEEVRVHCSGKKEHHWDLLAALDALHGETPPESAQHEVYGAADDVKAALKLAAAVRAIPMGAWLEHQRTGQWWYWDGSEYRHGHCFSSLDEVLGVEGAA